MGMIRLCKRGDYRVTFQIMMLSRERWSLFFKSCLWCLPFSFDELAIPVVCASREWSLSMTSL
jgi:hypothetical protein